MVKQTSRSLIKKGFCHGNFLGNFPIFCRKAILSEEQLQKSNTKKQNSKSHKNTLTRDILVTLFFVSDHISLDQNQFTKFEPG